jgi:hypothetical protein
MRIFQMIPATDWSAVYLDEAQVAPLAPWMAENDRPPESLPLVRVPLVCWAYMEDPFGTKEILHDGGEVPHRYIAGMEAVIGSDGDAQVMPSSGHLFVGYLHASQPLSTLAAQAQLVWDFYAQERGAGRAGEERREEMQRVSSPTRTCQPLPLPHNWAPHVRRLHVAARPNGGIGLAARPTALADAAAPPAPSSPPARHWE